MKTNGVEPVNIERRAVTSHDLIESQLVSWIREVVKSNDQLATVLQRLHRSCEALVAENPTKDAEELSLQVEDALRNAKHLKNMFLSESDHPHREED